jgi:hypothetical protein
MNDDEKTIFRIQKNKDNPYAMIDRRVLENPALSWKAKGLLAYLLSRPDNWEVQIGDLLKRSTDGESATREAINELEVAGHIQKTAERAEGARFLRWVMLIHEHPVPNSERTHHKRLARKSAQQAAQTPPEEPPAEPLCDFPHVDFPHVDFPHVENRPLNNTDLTNINNGAEAPNLSSPLPNPSASPSGGLLTDEPAPPTQPTKPALTEAWGLDWHLARGGDYTPPTQDQQAEAKLRNSVNLFPPDYQRDVEAFILASGIHPIKADLSGWISAIKNQREKTGLLPEDITEAVAQLRKSGMTIKDIFSAMATAGSIHTDRAQRKIKAAVVSAATQETPLAQALKTFRPHTGERRRPNIPPPAAKGI